MSGNRLKDAPTDLAALAEELSIPPKRLVRLKEKHGEDALLSLLRRQWWEGRDHPRLLHRRSEHGYTATPDQALPDEPEAVSEAEQAIISAEARANFARLREEQLTAHATQKAVGRLRRAEARARKLGIDALPHLLAIESEIRALEARIDNPGPGRIAA